MSIKTAPEPPFQHLVRQANKLMDQMQKGYFNFCPSETWTPSVNLYETDDGYQICVDLAGVEKEKIDVEVEGQRLKLRGTRQVPVHEEGSVKEHDTARPRIHLMEIDHGSFCREVDLPIDVRRDRIRATYRNGLLWVEIPKEPAAS